MEQKKMYQKPEIEVIQIFSQDSIMTSGLDGDLLEASMGVEDADGIIWD